MNPPLSEIIKGLKQYRKLYGEMLRSTKDPKDNRHIRRKYDRFKKAFALLEPMLSDWDRGKNE
jgi:hypothetical protein